jgi:hypothetical protein
MAQSYSTPVRTTLIFTTIARWKLATQCLNDHPDIWHRYGRQMRPTYTVYDENSPLNIEHCTNISASYVSPRLLIPESQIGRGDLCHHQNPYLRAIFFSICVQHGMTTSRRTRSDSIGGFQPCTLPVLEPFMWFQRSSMPPVLGFQRSST